MGLPAAGSCRSAPSGRCGKELAESRERPGVLARTGGWQMSPAISGGFVVGGGCSAEQARDLVKEPAELALLSLDGSNWCLLRELGVVGGCENCAGVQTPSVTPRLADSRSSGSWEYCCCCCCVSKSEECSEGDLVCAMLLSLAYV